MEKTLKLESLTRHLRKGFHVAAAYGRFVLNFICHCYDLLKNADCKLSSVLKCSSLAALSHRPTL